MSIETSVTASSQLEQVERRIAVLERSARRWKACALAMLSCGLLVAFGATQAAPEKSTAQAFEVIDSAGKMRARLGLAKSGEPALELFDTAGVPQASLALGSFLRPEDERIEKRQASQRRLFLSDPPITASLRLGVKDDEPAIEIGSGDRLRVMRLRDDFGDERIELRVGPYVRPDLPAGATKELVEATVRMKAPNEFLAMELGVEPISMARPSDRRRGGSGRLVEEATPYMTMYGWCEEPIFLLSNWAGDHPSMDLWNGGGASDSLLRVPSGEKDSRDTTQR